MTTTMMMMMGRTVSCCTWPWLRNSSPSKKKTNYDPIGIFFSSPRWWSLPANWWWVDDTPLQHLSHTAAHGHPHRGVVEESPPRLAALYGRGGSSWSCFSHKSNVLGFLTAASTTAPHTSPFDSSPFVLRLAARCSFSSGGGQMSGRSIGRPLRPSFSLDVRFLTTGHRSSDHHLPLWSSSSPSFTLSSSAGPSPGGRAGGPPSPSSLTRTGMTRRWKNTIKTNKSVAKRFRVRGDGTLVRQKAGKSHNTGHKKRGRVNRLGQSTTIKEKKHEAKMKRCMGVF